MKRILYTLTVCLLLPFAQSPVLAQSHQKGDENWPDSIKYYQQQFNTFKDGDIPTPHYLETAYALAYSCKEGQQYELGERVAAQALVRGSFLADSCWYAPPLFSLLAYFYEQRGDTIMPQHFHRKSQILSVKYAIAKESPDSAEMVNKKFDYLITLIENSKSTFNHDHPAYLYYLNDLCWSVGESGNIFEAVYLGEQILQLVNDYQLSDQEGICYAPYYWLLYFYPITDDLDKATALLPQATEYVRKFPQDHIIEADLYVNIGNGLMEAGCYKKALPYLIEAKNKAPQQLKEQIEQLDKKIELCKKRN